MQFDTQGQWWSILSTHFRHIRQWCERSNFHLRHELQRIDLVTSIFWKWLKANSSDSRSSYIEISSLILGFSFSFVIEFWLEDSCCLIKSKRTPKSFLVAFERLKSNLFSFFSYFPTFYLTFVWILQGYSLTLSLKTQTDPWNINLFQHTRQKMMRRK